MTRIVERPITMLKTSPDGSPAEYQDKDEVHEVVEMVDRWIEAGEWIEAEADRFMFRVLTKRGGVYDLQCQDGQWKVYRAFD